jgi:hypothetical protein
VSIPKARLHCALTLFIQSINQSVIDNSFVLSCFYNIEEK